MLFVAALKRAKEFLEEEERQREERKRRVGTGGGGIMGLRWLFCGW